MKIQKLLLLLLPLFCFSACNVSMLSKKEMQDLSKLQVKITIDDGKLDTGLNQIKVLLTDGIKQIVNNDIKILLNDSELKHIVNQDFIFNKTSYYSAPTSERNNAYYFEIILSDNSRHPLAYIQPFEEHLSAKFNVPNHVTKNEDFILKWIDLKTPHHLEFTNGANIKQKVDHRRSLIKHKDGLIDTLCSSAGEYIIPRSYFNNDISKTENLALKLNRKEHGMMNPILIKNSTITYIHTIEKNIRFEKSSNLVLSY